MSSVGLVLVLLASLLLPVLLLPLRKVALPRGPWLALALLRGLLVVVLAPAPLPAPLLLPLRRVRLLRAFLLLL